MEASEFEFRHRFWIISAIYFAAFGCYSFQHTAAAQTFGLWLAGGRGAPPERENSYVSAFLILASVFAVLAALMRTWGTAYLHSKVVHDSRLRTERLVADGPFRHVRNPLYFGNLLLASAFAFIAPPLGFILLIGLEWLFVYRLILREEHGLVRMQGEHYRQYCAAVPRVLPALAPQIPAGGQRPTWGQAVRGEAPIIAFAVLLIVFVMVRKEVVLRWGVPAAFAVYFAARFYERRQGGA